jgi:hypothetical protein
MSKHPQRREITRRQERRIRNDIAVLKKTGEVSEYLAKKAAKYEWVRREAFPLLYPPPPLEPFDFAFDYLTSASQWWGSK